MWGELDDADDESEDRDEMRCGVPGSDEGWLYGEAEGDELRRMP